MVRRVGFRDTESAGLEPGKSPTDGKPEAGRNWYAIIFVSCWLGGWTLAIFLTTAGWLKALDEGDVASASFDPTWLLIFAIFAIGSWTALAIYLIWLLLGGKVLRPWRDRGSDAV